MDSEALLQKQKKRLSFLVAERKECKKEILAKQEREIKLNEEIKLVRSIIERIEDGEAEDGELESLEDILAVDHVSARKAQNGELNSGGGKMRSVSTRIHAFEGKDWISSPSEAAEDWSDEEEMDLPVKGMAADLHGQPKKSEKLENPAEKLPPTPPQKITGHGMVADAVEAELCGYGPPVETGMISRDAAPGFEDRIPRPQPSPINSFKPRDISPSERTDVSSTSAGERRKIAESPLLPRSQRPKARPTPQIYVPPRSRFSGGQRISGGVPPATSSAQKSQSAGVNVSFTENGTRDLPEGKMHSESAWQTDRGQSSIAHRPQGRLAMNGLYEQISPEPSEKWSSGASVQIEGNDSWPQGNQPQRLPTNQQISAPNGAPLQENLKGDWGKVDKSETQEDLDNAPNADFAFPNLGLPKINDAKPVRGREWDSEKPADPQEALYHQARTRNWADAEPATPSGGANGMADPFKPSERAPQGAWASQNDMQPAPRGAWAKPGLTEVLKGSGATPFSRLGSVPPRVASSGRISDNTNVEAFEQESRLRVRSDTTPDAERRKQMRSNRDLHYPDYVRGRETNILEGLELHQQVLSEAEQDQMKSIIEDWVQRGYRNEFRGRTFSAPRKWAPGKGRLTVQFGCCYNYATDKQGRSPGIIAEEIVEPMPPILVALAQRLVRWNVLPKAMEPDSAIVNIYDVGDCIPPHIDHHDFSRPFCTLSLLSTENIMFGQKLVPEGPGEFHGRDGKHTEIPLPVGSCLVLNGNGADIAMHCVPPVKRKRMSITLRRMGNQHAVRVKAAVHRSKSGAWRVPEEPIKEKEEEDHSAPFRNVMNLSDFAIKDKRTPKIAT